MKKLLRRRKLQFVSQSEVAECGLACLAMIATFHGYESDVRSLRERFQLSSRGMTLARMIEIAYELHLDSRPLSLEIESMRLLRTPCILHWNLNHFVVLRKVLSDSVLIYDPAIGGRRVSLKDVSASFTGIALELQPSAGFQDFRLEHISINSIVGRVRGWAKAFIHIFSLTLILELIILTSPIFIQLVIDKILPNQNRDILSTISIVFLVLAVLQGIVSLIRGLSLISFGSELNFSWTRHIFGHLLRLPESFFSKRNIGDLMSRFGSISVIQQAVSNKFVEAIFDSFMALLTVAMLLHYNEELSMITISGFVLYFALRLLTYPSLREATVGQIAASANQQSQLMEVLRGSQTIRLYNKSAMETARFANITVGALNRTARLQRLTLILNLASSFIGNFVRIAAVWIGARLTMDGHLSTGMLIAYLGYNEQFTSRAYTLIDYSAEVGILKLHAKRLADIALATPEDVGDEKPEFALLKYDVELRNVSFRYAPEEPWILRNCNVMINAGESIAITGPSGCGKSTLLKLVIGLLDPNEGEILIGGYSLAQIGKKHVRDAIGAVMQEDQLFSGTISENISFFQPDSTVSDVRSAIRQASVLDEIEALPMGLDTLVGDMGSALSGGQKQRILLARALYRKPKILVLDEATSHLDIGTEFLVISAIRNLEITRIFAAHRPETISSADRILKLEMGSLSERQI